MISIDRRYCDSRICPACTFQNIRISSCSFQTSVFAWQEGYGYPFSFVFLILCRISQIIIDCFCELGIPAIRRPTMISIDRRYCDSRICPACTFQNIRISSCSFQTSVFAWQEGYGYPFSFVFLILCRISQIIIDCFCELGIPAIRRPTMISIDRRYCDSRICPACTFQNIRISSCSFQTSVFAWQEGYGYPLIRIFFKVCDKCRINIASIFFRIFINGITIQLCI